LLDKALRLCQASFGTLATYDGEFFRTSAHRGSPQGFADLIREPFRPSPGLPLERLVHGETLIHVADLRADEMYRSGNLTHRALTDQSGARTQVWIALRRDDTLLGMMVIYRREVLAFSDKQIALLENFAEQAVIAMENARLLGELRTARDTAEASLQQLKAAQANLIQAEKMASLGQLTAGIAHEIKNPLNFVNNFAELSGDLLDELHNAVATNQQGEIDELTATLKGNLAKIAEHGRRADGIVRGMLEHSRGSSGERRWVNLNTLVDEALNLAYHGARAQDQTFNITLQRDFDEGVATITLAPQDVTRVLLNLFSNGFYAARRRQSMEATPDFEPTLRVATRELGDAVEIRVRDNGIGIPEEVKGKLFQPFFTTKPTGEGTGLGLSISYDIVTQQHSGSIMVDSKVGEFSEFTIRLPRNP
jgi:signal transduction histidine kinase